MKSWGLTEYDFDPVALRCRTCHREWRPWRPYCTQGNWTITLKREAQVARAASRTSWGQPAFSGGTSVQKRPRAAKFQPTRPARSRSIPSRESSI
eukprot:1180706-Prorocentrum_minimum.AAC.4